MYNEEWNKEVWKWREACLCWAWVWIVCGKLKKANAIMREKEEEKKVPHGGLESMQYSRSWSCSIGGWVMSAIVEGYSEKEVEGRKETK